MLRRLLNAVAAATMQRRLTTTVTISAVVLLFLLVRSGDAQQPAPGEPEYSQSERSHWSLQPRGNPSPPRLSDDRDRSWCRNPIDTFVLHRLNQAGLRPAPSADRRTLARRLYLHVTGLPPSPEQLQCFLANPAADAYERLVDQLLASPAYGERWGQHWLDVVRYAETEGFEYDRYRTGAWRFRDYVISSLNADKPYDQFVGEQLAGDEATQPSPEGLVAAGFHRLGPIRRNAGNGAVSFSRNEVLTEMTDAVGLVFLGLTVGCARCHDHMYDPIKQKDYYRLQSFLAATHEHDVPVSDPARYGAWKREKDRVEREIKQLKEVLETADEAEQPRLTKQLTALQSQVPEPLPVISSVHNDRERQTAIHVLERGSTDLKRDAVGPRVLGVLLPEGTDELPGDLAQPRTQLARWICEPQHPLTARVLANRIWHYHFGLGLVATPNDFGANGDLPSHPELLDFLANRIVERHWRIKRVHRMILTSSVYRQSSRTEAAQNARKIDPDQRLLWQFRRRRLTAEQLRDTMLQAAGLLNRQQFGPSVIPPVEPDLVGLLYKPSQWKVTDDTGQQHRRSIYLIAKRNLRVPFLELFDSPALQISCPRRESSTHAPQALEMLNGTLTNELARAMAARLVLDVGADPGRQVERAFQLVLGRSPTPRERKLTLDFLHDQPLKEFALALFNTNEFLYID